MLNQLLEFQWWFITLLLGVIAYFCRGVMSEVKNLTSVVNAMFLELKTAQAQHGERINALEKQVDNHSRKLEQLQEK